MVCLVSLLEDGRPVAGGISDVARAEMFVRSIETGVSLDGKPTKARDWRDLKNALVLASDSEVKRGGWDWFSRLLGCPVASVVYK